MSPIYNGEIKEPDPPTNPEVPKKDPKTKQPVIDPETKKPVMVKKFTEDEFKKKLDAHQEATHKGGGFINIPALGLKIELDSKAVRNAYDNTHLSKAEILSRTHPYAWVVLLEGAADGPFHYVKLSSTWRPMLGSVLHKLGDAIDLTYIGTDENNLFHYGGATVTGVAKTFNGFIYGHRYAKPGSVFYSGDDYNTNVPGDQTTHKNHLHYTVNRLKPINEGDGK